MICFASPAEQHFWRFPKSLLSRGLDAPPSIPINTGILQGHLLCAGTEYPLVGDQSVVALLSSASEDPLRSKMTDRKLFSENIYDEVHEKLKQDRLLCENAVTLRTSSAIHAYSTHPVSDCLGLFS
jgi:DEAD/DEAH box helicase domain-containing protein